MSVGVQIVVIKTPMNLSFALTAGHPLNNPVKVIIKYDDCIFNVSRVYLFCSIF